MYEWSKMSVGILGAGIENIALTKYLLKNGAKVIIYDKNDPALISEKLKTLENNNLMVVAGKDYRRKVSVHDMFFRSPGMPLDLAKKVTKNKGVLTSAMQLFFELCPAKIIGVTGTKGKGTTCALTASILGQRGNVYLMGNIGRAPFDNFDEIKSDDWVVMEMSSFQLEDMTLSPHIAVVLNITPDHLAPLNKSNPNYHKNLAAYVEAKRKIVENQRRGDFVILGVSDDLFDEFESVSKGKIFRIGKTVDGCYIDGNDFFVNIGGTSDMKAKVTDFKVQGKHHLINAQAAILASVLAGATDDNITEGLRKFEGLPHRMQFVGSKDGVDYYDDSYATDPEASMAAIRSFDKPVVLICGGSSKGAEFREWANLVANSEVETVIVIGQESKKIIKALDREKYSGKKVLGLDKMDIIVRKAQEIAQNGGVVLLSPACASFDLFKNASDRGDQFREAVRAL